MIYFQPCVMNVYIGKQHFIQKTRKIWKEIGKSQGTRYNTSKVILLWNRYPSKQEWYWLLTTVSFVAYAAKQIKTNNRATFTYWIFHFIAESTIQSWPTFSVNFIKRSFPTQTKKIQKEFNTILRDLEYKIDQG